MLFYSTLWGQSYGGLSIDNDLFFGKDYYYSSGIFLQYGTTKNGREKPLNNEDLFKIEIIYTKAIDNPKILNQDLALNPESYVQIICNIFKAKN